MTRHDHHSFGLGSGQKGHHRGGGSRARTNTADSDSSFLSIRNLVGDARDLDDDVHVVSAAVRSMSLRPRERQGGFEGGVPTTPRTPLPRKMPSFDGITDGVRVSFSPSSSHSGSPTKGRVRAWTAGDADIRQRGSPESPTFPSSQIEGKRIGDGSFPVPIPPLFTPERKSTTGPSASEDDSSSDGIGAAAPSKTDGGGATAREQPDLQMRPRPFSDGGVELAHPSRIVPDSMKFDSLKEWLAAGSGVSAGGVERFDNEYSGGEEKREITADEEEGETDFSGAVPPSPVRTPKSLPPRDEVDREEHLDHDSVSDPRLWHSGRLGSPSSRPPTIAEEPSFGATSHADGDALPPPSTGSSEGRNGVGYSKAAEGYDPYYSRPGDPIGASRPGSLSSADRDKVLRAVKWASSRDDEEYDNSHHPDGFDDEALYRSSDIGSENIRRQASGYDDVDVSSGSGLGSRHGGKRGKTSLRKENRSVGDGEQYVYLCGRRLPCFRWPLFHMTSPSWSRVSSAIVRHAPCFWCSRRFETSATDRAILIRLNILCTVFAAVQVGAGLFVLIVQWGPGGEDNADERLESLTPIYWTGTIPLLAVVGLVLVITMLSTLRVIREMNLAGALRYMWALYWLLPIEILLMIGLFGECQDSFVVCFAAFYNNCPPIVKGCVPTNGLCISFHIYEDTHNVTSVWVKHAWTTPSLSWFRDSFCSPPGTADTKCIVPIGGGEGYKDEEAWCNANYNATDCKQIRDSAQDKMLAMAYAFMITNGVWALLLIALLALALTLLVGIISSPIVQSSKQSNIPFWLILPIAGCLAGGAFLMFSPYTATKEEEAENIFWIGIAFFACAGTFFMAALLGWIISVLSVLNNKDKRRKQIAILLFIAVLLLTVLTVAAIFTASLIHSSNFVDIEIDDNERGEIACRLNAYDTCTRCDKPVNRCPEWTEDDLRKVVQTHLKTTAALAAILAIYATSALRFGFVLRKHLSRYQIDYV